MDGQTAQPTVPLGRASWIRLAICGGGAWLLGWAASLWLERQPAELVPALLDAKRVAVAASRPSVLAEIFVQPGQSLTPGDRVLRLVDETLDHRLAGQRRRVEELQVEQRRVMAAADVELQWRLRELDADTFETELKAADCLQQRLTRQVEQLAWREHLTDLDRWLGDEGVDLVIRPISLPDTPPSANRVLALLREQAAENSAEALTAQLELCDQRLEQLKSAKDDLESKVRISLGVDLAQTRIDQAQAELAALEQEHAALTLTSSTHGTVGLLRHQPGDVLNPGECVVEILDEDQRFVFAQVPSEALSRFPVGSRLSIRFADAGVREGVIADVPPQSVSGSGSLIPIRLTHVGQVWPRVPIGARVMIEVPQK